MIFLLIFERNQSLRCHNFGLREPCKISTSFNSYYNYLTVFFSEHGVELFTLTTKEKEDTE